MAHHHTEVDRKSAISYIFGGFLGMLYATF